MSMAKIRAKHGPKFKRGAKVKTTDIGFVRMATITGTTDDGWLRVRFDGDKWSTFYKPQYMEVIE